jgi:hypothetical protein
MLASDLETPFRGVRISRHGGRENLRAHLYSARMAPGHCFSHTTAARLWGIPLPRRTETEHEVHVSSLGGTRPRMLGVVGHDLSDRRARVVVRAGVRVTDPATTWLQLAMMVPDRWLIAAGDHLVTTPIVLDPGDPRPHLELDELVDRARHFRGRSAKRVHEAVERVRAGAESPRETFLRLALLDSGLPEPELNAAILDDRGSRIAIGDLVYRDARVVVEYDGEQHRTDTVQYRRDVERHDALVEAGWLCIRVGLHSPGEGPRSAVARTREALRARTARSTRHSVPPDDPRVGTE